jgi:hypothetical protein
MAFRSWGNPTSVRVGTEAQNGLAQLSKQIQQFSDNDRADELLQLRRNADRREALDASRKQQEYDYNLKQRDLMANALKFNDALPEQAQQKIGSAIADEDTNPFLKSLKYDYNTKQWNSSMDQDEQDAYFKGLDKVEPLITKPGLTSKEQMANALTNADNMGLDPVYKDKMLDSFKKSADLFGNGAVDKETLKAKREMIEKSIDLQKEMLSNLHRKPGSGNSSGVSPSSNLSKIVKTVPSDKVMNSDIMKEMWFGHEKEAQNFA